MSDLLTQFLESTRETLAQQQAQISALTAAVTALAATHDDPGRFSDAFNVGLRDALQQTSGAADQATMQAVAETIRIGLLTHPTSTPPTALG